MAPFYYSKATMVKTYKALHFHLESHAFIVCSTLIIIALILVFAEFTYRLIEVPGIRFGRKLITQWNHA